MIEIKNLYDVKIRSYKSEIHLRKDIQGFNNKDVPYFYTSFDGIMLLAFYKRDIIGALNIGYQKEGYLPEKKIQHCMLSIGVSADYRHQGVAEKLIEKMFRICVKENIKQVLQSPYTDEGYKFVAKKFYLYSKKYYHHVRFYDNMELMYSSYDTLQEFEIS